MGIVKWCNIEIAIAGQFQVPWFEVQVSISPVPYRAELADYPVFVSTESLV